LRSVFGKALGEGSRNSSWIFHRLCIVLPRSTNSRGCRALWCNSRRLLTLHAWSFAGDRSSDNVHLVENTRGLWKRLRSSLYLVSTCVKYNSSARKSRETLRRKSSFFLKAFDKMTTTGNVKWNYSCRDGLEKSKHRLRTVLPWLLEKGKVALLVAI